MRCTTCRTFSVFCKCRSSERGFSLAEAMIAMGVMSVAMVGFSQLMSHQSKNAQALQTLSNIDKLENQLDRLANYPGTLIASRTKSAAGSVLSKCIRYPAPNLANDCRPTNDTGYFNIPQVKDVKNVPLLNNGVPVSRTGYAFTMYDPTLKDPLPIAGPGVFYRMDATRCPGVTSATDDCPLNVTAWMQPVCPPINGVASAGPCKAADAVSVGWEIRQMRESKKLAGTQLRSADTKGKRLFLFDNSAFVKLDPDRTDYKTCTTTQSKTGADEFGAAVCMQLACQAGQTLVGINKDTKEAICTTATSCTAGQISQGFDSRTKLAKCVNANPCPGNQVLVNMSGANVICGYPNFSQTAGLSAMSTLAGRAFQADNASNAANANNAIRANTAGFAESIKGGSCYSGEMMIGINSNGTPRCGAVPVPPSPPGGGGGGMKWDTQIDSAPDSGLGGISQCDVYSNVTDQTCYTENALCKSQWTMDVGGVSHRRVFKCN